MNKENQEIKNKVKRKPKKKSSFFKVVKIIFLSFFLFLFIGGTAVLAFVWTIIKDVPHFDPKHIRAPETSYIYDNQGIELAQLHQEQNRTVISIRDVPEHVQRSLIAIEDERFEEHFGIDLTGIIRAAKINFEQKSIVQGASTITQQLMRNAFLTPEQTVERKLQEVWLAIKAEREYTKSEILEMYMNLVYFGSGAYGIEAAAETYFDKSAVDINIAEAAMLAGLLNSPNSNNPFLNEERAITRTNTVIKKMESLGFITSAEATEAFEYEFVYGDRKILEYPHPYFVDYVLHNELVKILSEMEEFGNRENAYEAIYTRGLRVHTTMDRELQAHVEYTLDRTDRYPATVRIDMDKFKTAFQEAGNKMPPNYPSAYIDEENGIPQPQSAFVLANPSTGEIRALGGGREYRKQGNEVLRFVSLRQPGSAIKPIVSYIPAFEEGILSPGSIVHDVPFTAGSYSPRSWDGRYWGPMTARDAIRWSRNIPAVAVLQMVTPAVGTSYAEKMGITSFSDDDRGSLAVALGGVSGISVFDMTQAFATVANQGVKQPLHTITRIEDSSGNLIYKQEATPETVLTPQTAYIISNILEDTQRTTFTGNRLYIDRPVAAKTGTTNDSRDTYLCAYTPNVVSVFWMGYDFKDMGRIYGGHGLSTAITRDVYQKAFEGLDIITFESLRPEGLTTMAICGESGMRPTDLCRKAGAVKSDFFNVNSAPKGFCDQHVEVEVCEVTELLPGDFCPAESIIQAVFFIGERSENKPPVNKCDFHKSQPGKPASFTAQWNSSINGVILNWTSPSGSGNIKEYRIYRSSAGESRTLIATVKGNRYTDTKNLVNEGQYTYTLYSVNSQNVLSDSVTATTTIPPSSQSPPQTPALYSPSNGQSGVATTPTLFWNNTGGTSYTVEISRNAGFSEIVYSNTIDRTVITIGQQLSEGTTYYWRVSSANSAGSSGWSATRSFSTVSAPAADADSEIFKLMENNFFNTLLLR